MRMAAPLDEPLPNNTPFLFGNLYRASANCVANRDSPSERPLPPKKWEETGVNVDTAGAFLW